MLKQYNPNMLNIEKTGVKRWRLIDSGAGSAKWNMAVDEALLRSYKEGDTPVLRLYRWQTSSISFGRFSRPEETLDYARVRYDAVDTVRRITGGGILVHSGDLSYSLTVPRALIKERGVKESYHYLCGFLIALYRRLGLDAGFARERRLETSGGDVCLAGREAYDIVVNGKKLGGNAQRHSTSAMLQHGTLPLSIDRERFAPLFRKDSGLDKAATLDETGIGMDIDALKPVLLEAFRDTFGARLEPDTLREEEKVHAQTLLDKKYATEAWNVHGKERI